MAQIMCTYKCGMVIASVVYKGCTMFKMNGLKVEKKFPDSNLLLSISLQEASQWSSASELLKMTSM